MAARLRQVVVAARELDPVRERLRSELGLGEPYADPGVAHFGLSNAVMAIGDCFIEVVSPARADAAAARHLERCGGDCGYMVMFEVADIDAARRRAREAGVRAVWEIDLPDISGTHLHPRDMAGAIVSVDQPRPPGSWLWAGPGWSRETAQPGGLAGAVIAVADPRRVAEIWSAVIGEGTAASGQKEAAVIELGDQRVEFVPDEHGQCGLIEVSLRTGRSPAGDDAEIAGVRFQVRSLTSG